MMRWNQPQKKKVYALHEGSAEERGVFGEKGANLCEMHRLGLPVPAAFIITTETCNEFFMKKSDTGDSLFEEVRKAVNALEKKTGQAFYAEGCAKRDDKKLPLLLSVRSAAPVNLPGMTETVLNIGINDEVVDIMSRVSDNSRWALDTQRRFLQMFGSVVMGVEKEKYENIMIEARAKANAEHNSLLDSNDLAKVIRQFKGLAEVPDDPWMQLRMCIEAVFNSWYSPPARRYRDVNSLSEEMGVAVIIQKMVFGNQNILSGSGVASTRDYRTGAPVLHGKFLRNAAGEEVIDPTRQSRCISLEDLGLELPKLHEKLVASARTLEAHYRDMQDIEFTVENQELYVLETNRGRRTARASVNLVVGMVEDKVITEREALMRLQPEQMNYFLHPMIDNLKVDVQNDEAVRNRVIGRGVAASIGAVAGRVAFTSAQVMEFAARNESSILVKYDTSCTEDLVGMRGSVGCITMLGGYTSHAALVMRSMGKPCVTAVGEKHEISIDVLGDSLVVKSSGKTIKKGDLVTVDGATGTVYEGELPIVMAAADENFQKVMHWADKYKRMAVFCNTRTLRDVNLASRLGVEGVGLARTEHMFFADDRVDHVRRAILSDTPAQRMTEMMKLLPLQQQDFVDMFLVMQHRPIIVRLLDRNLSDFLPNPQSEDYESEVLALAKRLDVAPDRCFQRIQELQENNPTLGNRGSRLAISYPEFTVLQTEAIVGAALELRSHHIVVKPQMMLPLICTDHEIDLITPIISKACDRICARMWADSAYQSAYIECSVGALIELPRACLRADKIAKAKQVDFINIGTNDLTQLMFGFSREDAHHFMPSYVDKHLVAKNPFVSIDVPAVGTMVQTALERAKKANHAIKVGVCGDHAGDPDSVHFFERIGIDYISCSPFKVPIAKMAAAQAHIRETSKIQLQRQKSAPKMF